MNVVPFVIALLLVAAITVQGVAFFIRRRQRREFEEWEENKVIDFNAYKKRLGIFEAKPKARKQEPADD